MTEEHTEINPALYTVLENKLEYSFKNREYLMEALRHSSYVNELPDADIHDNERMEFLGDAVLSLIVSDMLMKRRPDMDEGNLSKIRAYLVNEFQLSDIAREIELGQYVSLGKGELLSNGCDKNSILADAFEAVTAALYLDGGFSSAYAVIEKLFDEKVSEIKNITQTVDSKSRFQEIFQVDHKTTPVYTLLEEQGPDHDKTFKIRLTAGDIVTEGVGKTKKTAEQDAAGKALDLLEDLPGETPA